MTKVRGAWIFWCFLWTLFWAFGGNTFAMFISGAAAFAPLAYDKLVGRTTVGGRADKGQALGSVREMRQDVPDNSPWDNLDADREHTPPAA